MIAAGKCNQLLTLEEPSETVVNGEATVKHTVRCTAWAMMEFIGGTAEGVTVGASYRFTTRHRFDVVLAAGWQLGLKGTARKFRVATVGDPDGRHHDLVIMANEVVLPTRVT